MFHVIEELEAILHSIELDGDGDSDVADEFRKAIEILKEVKE
jgi:hypothetical protein